MSGKLSANNSTGFNRLLLSEISIPQLLLYAAGVFIGLSIILLTFQAYRDFTSHDDDAKVSTTEYVVLSGKVNGLSVSNHASVNIDSVRKHEWIVKAAEFTPADFSVTASLDLMGRSMATALFFEAVPDDFLEEVPSGFNFDPNSEDNIIPIILPRDYLALYNFGFASSRGLPKIGEETMKSLPFKISVAGNGKQQNFDAHIVGFTNRLNTIAVPLEFIQWANSKFGKKINKNSSRIIAEVSVSPSSQEFKEFLNANNLVIGGDKENSIDFGTILRNLVAIVIAVGSVICLLSIALLMLSLSLLLHKSREAIYRLKVMGYHPMKITLKYTTLTLALNLILLLAVLVGVYIANEWLSEILTASGIGHKCTVTGSALLGAVIMCLISLYGFFVFKFKIYRI